MHPGRVRSPLKEIVTQKESVTVYQNSICEKTLAPKREGFRFRNFLLI